LSYGEKYRVRALAHDGRTYRVQFAQDGYTGSVTTLPTVPGGITLEVGTPGLQSLWDTVLPQRLTVSLFVDAAISDLYAVTADEWEVSLWLEGTPNVLLWYGYLQPAITRQPLYRAGTAEMVAVGFMAPANVTAWTGATREDLAKLLTSAITTDLPAVPPAAGLAMLTRYYPYLEGAEMTGEPMERLQADGRVWEDKQGADVIRGVSGALGAEIFTSASSVWVVQRGALLDLVAANVGTPATAVPVRTLTWAGTYASPAIAVSDLVRDLDALNVEVQYDIAPAPPEAVHVAAYRWQPPVGRVFTNERFLFDSGGGIDVTEPYQDPQYWDVAAESDPAMPRYTWIVASSPVGTYRARRVNLSSGIISGYPNAGSSSYGLQVASNLAADAMIAAVQRTGFEVPGGEENVMRLTCVGRRTLSFGGVDPDEEEANIYLRVDQGADTWYLVNNTIIIESTVILDQVNIVSVQDADSLNKWGGSPVTGTILIPAGTELRDGNRALRLTKPFRIGDTTLECDARQIAQGASTTAFTYYHWVKTSTKARVNFILPSVTASGANLHVDTVASAPLVDPQGRPVEGIASLEVWQNVVGNPDTVNADSNQYAVYTTLDVSLTKGTADARGIEVMTLTGARGIREVLPDSPLGDGPRFDSISGLSDRTTGQSTLQIGTVGTPQAAGWKRGAYSVAEASTGVTLEEARARDASRQMADPVDMVYITAVLRSGDALILPHHVVIAEGIPRWRTYYRWDVTQARVELHAVALNESSAVSTAKRTLL